MNKATLDWLKKQLKNKKIASDIRKEITLLIKNAKYFTIVNGYLVARSNTVPVSSTNETWDRQEHEKKFTYRVKVEGEFNEDGVIDRANKVTKATRGVPYDQITDGMYTQIIPDLPQNFFQNGTQAMQVVYDNLSWITKILKDNRRVHVPFVNTKGDKFVIYVRSFDDNRTLTLLLDKFYIDHVRVSSEGNVFILPQLSVK